MKSFVSEDEASSAMEVLALSFFEVQVYGSSADAGGVKVPAQ